MDYKTQNHIYFAFLYRIISLLNANVNRFEFDEAGTPHIETPVLRLFIIVAAEQIRDAACDIVHLSLALNE